MNIERIRLVINGALFLVFYLIIKAWYLIFSDYYSRLVVQAHSIQAKRSFQNEVAGNKPRLCRRKFRGRDSKIFSSQSQEGAIRNKMAAF